MSNIITIELCAEDRARLDELTNAIAKLTNELKGHRSLQLKSIDENGISFGRASEDAAAVEDIPDEEPPAPLNEDVIMPEKVTPQPEPVEEAPTQMKPLVTHDMIRQKVTKLMASGDAKKKEATRNIVKAYANNVTNLPEDKWPEIWDKLTALEG